MSAAEKVGGGTNISTLKASTDVLKKEVTSLMSTDLITFFDQLEDPPFKVDMAIILNKGQNVEVASDVSEEKYKVSTPEANEEMLGAEKIQEDQKDLDGVENEMVKAVITAFVLDQSMIGTSSMSVHESTRPNIELESTLTKEGIDAPMTSFLASPPPPPPL